MKTYNSPMLQVVGINKSDIIVTSPGYGYETTATYGNLAPGQRGVFDPYDAGY